MARKFVPIRRYYDDWGKGGMKSLRDWYTKVLKADWKNFADIRKDFNSADFVGNDRYVFNIGGNNFRIVVIVIFLGHKVFIRFIGTHKEYDRIDNITQI